ncbi:MAG: hypothetical protein LC791_01840 [Acidobacteria bacterium]|nr:hypothetical protein [Acidobacteriota bacterium]
MGEEVGVFGRQDGLPQHLGNRRVFDDDTAFDGEVADERSIARHDARDGARCVGIETRDLRQVVGVGEEHPAQRAEKRRHDEEGGDAGVTGDADDVGGGHFVNWRMG